MSCNTLSSYLANPAWHLLKDPCVKKQIRKIVGSGSVKITGLIVAGANVFISGAGTQDNPYTISATGGGGGSSIWGVITGNIDDQTDLKQRLDSKADITDIEWKLENW